MIEAARQLAAMEPPAAPGVPGRLIQLAGQALWALPQGALYWPDEGMLIVADLHLEKGSSFARRGIFLPPYDTQATLAMLAALVLQLAPRVVVALGDSFHDRHAAERLDDLAQKDLAVLQKGRDWIWITGNHDPEPPRGLSGISASDLCIGPLSLRHEPAPGAGDGEIAGHLHPVGKIRVRGRTIRRRCFACDGRRMVLPAFGAYTGGLNVRDSAFKSLFTAELTAWLIGEEQVYPISRRKLLGD